MCGITGIAALWDSMPPDKKLLDIMCDTLTHRGPDGKGLDIKDGVGIAMRRLSIIDIEGGKQPIFNEDKTIRTVFNGEIYNFRELRKTLTAKGHVFTTKSDTEVIVHAYEEYGKDFVNHLSGMFAIALHDSSKKRLYLVRDHIGVKPLFYSVKGGYLIWGSEIKSVLASKLIPRSIDISALSDLLSWEYIPGHKTLFNDIKKLEPGHLIEINLDNPKIIPEEYWDVPWQEEPDKRKAGDWIEELDDIVSKSVKNQLVSDVPIGAFLSGGVDSSLIVASMNNAKTFSVGFEDPSYNELSWARTVADHLGSDHRDKVIQPDIIELFDYLVNFMDDPIGDFSIFPTYLISRHARNSVTVALSGDGGDELFGGYETYIAQEAAAFYSILPGFLRRKYIEPYIHAIKPRPQKKGLVNKTKRFVEGFGNSETLKHARWRIFMTEPQKKELFTTEAYRYSGFQDTSHIAWLYKKAGNRNPVNQSLYVDMKSYLCDNCLVKTDRMSMAASLEARVPLLDKELVEFSFRIPGKLKISNNRTKILLKKVADRHIPSECIYRPKEGFSIPVKNWLKTRFRPLLEDLLAPEQIKNDGIFRSDTIEKLKSEHLKGIANHSHILWTLIVFHAWKKRWINRCN